MYTNHHSAEHATGCRTAFAKRAYGFHGQQSGYRRPKYNVPLNIVDTENEFEVHVYATGFSKEDIKISVVEEVLYVSGNKELPEGYSPNFSKQEFPIKTFERTLNLNGLVETGSITAKQENGILIIHLPKTDIAKTKLKEITIS